MRDGESNARLNRVPSDRIRFVRALVEDGVRQLARTPPDLVVLDPPRQGCGTDVTRRVFTGLVPARAIYVSCDPESLARDLVEIVAAGYAVIRVQPVDMFPHTPHIETVVTVERARPVRRRGRA